MKKVFALMMALVIATTLCIPAFATGAGFDECETKVAYIPCIDDTGSNIGTDLTNPSVVTSDYHIHFASINGNLQLNGTVQGMEFDVQGSILTTNEAKSAVMYSAVDERNNFDVAYCAVERDLNNTPFFFKGYYENTFNLECVLKLYLQPYGTNALVIIESFLYSDLVDNILSSNIVPFDSKTANLNQAWFAKYYGPAIDYAELDTPQPIDNTSHVERDYSQSYFVFGEYVRYYYKVGFYCNVDDLSRRGSGQADVYVHVIESKTESRDNPSSTLNSDKQDLIWIESLNVKYKSAPYIILTAIDPVRNLKGSSSAVNLDVSFGYSYGLFSVAGSFNFDRSDTISTNRRMLPSESSTKGVMSAESGTMPSNTKIINKGNQYGATFEYKDVGGNSRSGTVGVSMDFRVVNGMHPSETKWDSYSNTYYIYVG